MSPEQAAGDTRARRPDRHLHAGLRALRDAGRRAAVHRARRRRRSSRKRLTEPRAERAAVRPTVPEAWSRRSRRRWPGAGRPVRHGGGVRPGARAAPAATTASPGRDHAAATAPALATTGAAPRRQRRAPVAATRSGSASCSAWACCSAGCRSHGDGARAAAGGAKRLAVLPFENLGGADDEYFADGVTDEVRGKLAALPGLQVTARGSSRRVQEEHARTCRDDRARAGGGYLLTGTVRWEKSGRRQPGAGEPRADPGAHRLRPGGSSRSTRRSPTSSRSRPTSPARWLRRSTWRSARARSEALAERPTAEPGGLRRLPQGRGDLPGHEHHGPADAPPRRWSTTSRHRPRLDFRRGLGPALARRLSALWERRPDPALRGRRSTRPSEP